MTNKLAGSMLLGYREINTELLDINNEVYDSGGGYYAN